MTRLRTATPLLAAALLLGGCSLPFRTSDDERKAACDRIAASAIQEKDAGKAKDIAARASSCYADIERG